MAEEPTMITFADADFLVRKMMPLILEGLEILSKATNGAVVPGQILNPPEEKSPTLQESIIAARHRAQDSSPESGGDDTIVRALKTYFDRYVPREHKSMLEDEIFVDWCWKKQDIILGVVLDDESESEE